MMQISYRPLLGERRQKWKTTKSQRAETKGYTPKSSRRYYKFHE